MIDRHTYRLIQWSTLLRDISKYKGLWPQPGENRAYRQALQLNHAMSGIGTSWYKAKDQAVIEVWRSGDGDIFQKISSRYHKYRHEDQPFTAPSHSKEFKYLFGKELPWMSQTT